MPYNGEASKQFGVYKSVCCGAKIVVNSGAAFPDCPNHRKLTTIWKPVVEENIISPTANDSQPDPLLEAHIDNRRLFDMAAGTLRLVAGEQGHLHGCKVCQGVLYFFMKQVIGPPKDNRPKSTDAA